MREGKIMNYILHFDGSCWPNPGGRCKFGWHIEICDGQCLGDAPRRLATGNGEVKSDMRTNNVAEFEGLIGALSWFARLAVDPDDALEVFGDSQLIINLSTHKSHTKLPHLAALMWEARALLKSLKCQWSAHWVHREENAEADAIAGG